MNAHLTLVVDNTEPDPDRNGDTDLTAIADAKWVHAAWLPRKVEKWRGKSLFGRHAAEGPILRSDTGAVTAEYAVVILAAVAFAGLLVAIMRSGEVQAMLVDLVRNALGAAG